jgi:hypothetical protein
VSFLRTREYCVGTMLSGLLYGSAPDSCDYWWAHVCMWICLGRDVDVKVDVPD